ncbi:MAG TPA: alpha/beta hydrolase [Devosiaceae bacterium]|nr:alpha/beta hydrolase [Devosiaceae bacterium]
MSGASATRRGVSAAVGPAGLLLKVAQALFAVALLAVAAMPATAAEPPKTVVLVHGTFVDGSSWSRVIPLLQAAGLRVIAVQNPLRSLADDVAVTKRAIEMAPGPVILVGHSWGGMVISEAGMDDKVKALVYVAAFALPKGQSVNSASAGSPPAPWNAALKADSGGYLWVPEETLGKYFAQDAPKDEVAVIAATQVPTFNAIFDDRLTQTAYETKPSWYISANADGAIQPAVERAMAKAIKAHLTQLDGNHVIMWTKPREVANVIIDAANSVQ